MVDGGEGEARGALLPYPCPPILLSLVGAPKSDLFVSPGRFLPSYFLLDAPPPSPRDIPLLRIDTLYRDSSFHRSRSLLFFPQVSPRAAAPSARLHSSPLSLFIRLTIDRIFFPIFLHAPTWLPDALVVSIYLSFNPCLYYLSRCLLFSTSPRDRFDLDFLPPFPQFLLL